MVLVNLAGILGVIKLARVNEGLKEEDGGTLLSGLGHGKREQRATVAWIQRVKDRWSCVGGLFAADTERRWRLQIQWMSSLTTIR